MYDNLTLVGLSRVTSFRETLSQNDTGFAVRLAYVRWLRARRFRVPETDRQLAKATGVSEAWLYKWKDRHDSPDSRAHAYKLADGLGVDREWLLDNSGTPPEPKLWNDWMSWRRKPAEELPAYMDFSLQIEMPIVDQAKEREYKALAKELQRVAERPPDVPVARPEKVKPAASGKPRKRRAAGDR